MYYGANGFSIIENSRIIMNEGENLQNWNYLFANQSSMDCRDNVSRYLKAKYNVSDLSHNIW